VLVLNIVSFVFLVYHAITFFDATPQALSVHIGKTRVPKRIVGASHYAAWLVASALVCWLVLGS
jgi:fumarate reductase subunit C